MTLLDVKTVAMGSADCGALYYMQPGLAL